MGGGAWAKRGAAKANRSSGLRRHKGMQTLWHLLRGQALAARPGTCGAAGVEISWAGIEASSDVAGGLLDVLGAAEVAPVVLVGAEGGDGLAFSGEPEVGVDDGECAGFGELGKDLRRDDVDAGEGEGLRVGGGPDEFGGAGEAGAATAERAVFVGEEVAAGGAVLKGEGAESALFSVKAKHAGEIDGAEDGDVVEDEWLAGFRPGDRIRL